MCFSGDVFIFSYKTEQVFVVRRVLVGHVSDDLGQTVREN